MSIDKHLEWTDFRMDKNNVHQLTHAHTHMVKYYLATKKEMLPFEIIGIKCQYSTLSKINLTDKYSNISLTCRIKKIITKNSKSQGTDWWMPAEGVGVGVTVSKVHEGELKKKNVHCFE